MSAAAIPPDDPWTPRVVPTTRTQPPTPDPTPAPAEPIPGAEWTPRDDSTLDLERALIGCLLVGTIDTPTTASDHGIDNTSWLVARHEIIWRHATRLARDGITPDQLLVADAIHGHGEARAYGGRPEEYLAGCVELAPTHHSTGHYADKVTERAKHRARLDLPRRLADLADDPDRYDQALTDWLTDRQIEQQADHVSIPTVHDLLTSDDPEYDWLVPGMLERRDRVILTAPEGAGKSTWMRQTAVQLAAGIHPLTGNPIPPVRVLVIDVENSARQNRREYKPLVARAHLNAQVIDNPDAFHERLRIEHRATLNLADPTDLTWLDHAIRDARPDVLITGPIYKLAAGDPNDEKEAKPIVFALDRIRAEHDIALLLEAHSKKAEGTDPRKRSKEPFGWSGWLRWPEFGLHLSDEGDITHWRGQRDASRQWPTSYSRGAQWPAWPWSIDTDPHAAHVARMKSICEQLGRVPGTRELAERMGLSHQWVAKVQAREGMAWGAYKAQFDTREDTR